MSSYEIPACAGKPYSPSNGSEGLDFQAAFCDRCQREADPRWDRGNGDGRFGCTILSDALLFRVGDPKYPHQWTHDERGRPTCTAFVPEIQP